MSTVEMKVLMRKSDSLSEEIKKLTSQLYDVNLEIAQRTCPFKVGDILKANVGLGLQGVIVKEVTPPQIPAGGHRWVIRTNAITKDGRESNRGVSYCNEDIANIGLRHV